MLESSYFLTSTSMRVYRYTIRVTEEQRRALKKLSVEFDSVNQYLRFLIDKETKKREE
jgi:hypothetical protein